MPYYSVARGNNIGIFTDYNDCKKSIDRFKNPKFRKFEKREEAEKFLLDNKEEKKEEENLYEDHIKVFTDGSCINNGKENVKGGIGIYFCEDDPRNVSLKLKEKDVTNNIAELTAILVALKILENEIFNATKILVISDSEYAIRCCTNYGKKLAENNWKTSTSKIPPNLDLVKKLYEICSKFKNIKFKHIMAHTGNNDYYSLGNNQADLLASKAIGVERKEEEKIYLNVPFARKDEAKLLGARWDVGKKKWYSMSTNPNLEKLKEKYCL